MNVGKSRTGRNASGQGGASVISPARLAAFEILRRVEDEGAFASVLLASWDEKMRSDDRALSYEIVMGVLRWQLWLDHLIEHYAGRSADSLDLPVRLSLRLGLYQLRFLSRIPASAIVNESVNLAYRVRLRSAAAFINAVLRRATRETEYDPAAKIDDPLERLAVETSHPAWLIERWARAFGLEETQNLARANNLPPPIAFRINQGLVEDEKGLLVSLAEAGAQLMPSLIAPQAWRVEGAGARVRALSLEGKIYLQDEASQLVSHILNAQAGERVLDACAAPGSKTTHVASLTRDSAFIVAGDMHEHRLRTVLEACERQRLASVKVVAHNAEVALPFTAQSFDRVLVDAPCTGTGTLRRNPEIRWRISQPDIADLAERQRRILFNASRMVRPCGRLVYSTCSVEPEENEEVVRAFLLETPSFRQIRAEGHTTHLSSEAAIRTWPHREGTDGFFIAAFERQT
jgi:16S rRNA (cytosine967-C5)-methyltransferase